MDQVCNYEIDSDDEQREQLHYGLVAIVIVMAGTSAKITRSMLRLRPIPIASLRFYESDKQLQTRQTHTNTKFYITLQQEHQTLCLFH